MSHWDDPMGDGKLKKKTVIVLNCGEGWPSPMTLFKNIYSTILLIFATTIIIGLIFTGKTSLADSTSPVLAFFLLWIAVLWLSMVEGGQASLVGLAPIKSEMFKDSHPRSFMSCKVCHTGDNLERYLMGRQFMVLALVFVINMCGAPLAEATLWGFPDWIVEVFLVTGWAMILFTCMLGQLNTQANACHYMLDYINSYFAVFTFWVAMAIEFSGLLHSSYLIQVLVAAAAGKKVESFEAERTQLQQAFFWFRVYMSLTLLCFFLAVTIEALYNGQTTMWSGVPHTVALILFIILMSIVGLLEGMQIAFFAVAKLPENERGEGKFAKWTCELLFKNGNANLPKFMVGRQLCVVSCFFVIARVTTLDIGEDDPNIFGVTDGLQGFFNTGLHAAVITTIVASISWQLVASAFPIQVLQFPLTYILLVWCLFLEATGLCNGAYVIAWVHRTCKGWKKDEAYIGTAEDRARKGLQGGVRSMDTLGKVRKSETGDTKTGGHDEFTADKDFAGDDQA